MTTPRRWNRAELTVVNDRVSNVNTRNLLDMIVVECKLSGAIPVWMSRKNTFATKSVNRRRRRRKREWWHLNEIISLEGQSSWLVVMVPLLPNNQELWISSCRVVPFSFTWVQPGPCKNRWYQVKLFFRHFSSAFSFTFDHKNCTVTMRRLVMSLKNLSAQFRHRVEIHFQGSSSPFVDNSIIKTLEWNMDFAEITLSRWVFFVLFCFALQENVQISLARSFDHAGIFTAWFFCLAGFVPVERFRKELACACHTTLQLMYKNGCTWAVGSFTPRFIRQKIAPRTELFQIVKKKQKRLFLSSIFTRKVKWSP